MTTQVDQLKESIANYKYDPAGIQQAQIAMLREVSDGKITLVDPTNPVVYLLECAAINASASMTHARVLTRNMYAQAAQTPEELYIHMSDKDFVDRFSLPSTAKFLFLFEKTELLANMVEDEENSNIRKMVIPRNTYIEVGDYTFGIEYPIVMRQMSHGGLQIVYDVEKTSPLKTLATNVIDWKSTMNDSKVEYVIFEVETQQFSIQSVTNAVTKSQPFITEIEVVDEYWYTRVWVDNADGTFTEIQTTHTDEVYDPLTVTAVLKLTGSTLTVKIPQVYVTTGLLDKSVRIDVYQTKGELDVDLSNYSPEQITTTFRTLNPAENDDYVAPIKNLQLLMVYCAGKASGGRPAMTFQELRKRVLTNSVGDASPPITPAQIEGAIERNGYTVVKNIDQITNRDFLATNSMPDPINSDLLTAAAAGISMWPVKLSDIVLLDSVTDNGDLVTIDPSTLYRWKDGMVEVVSSGELNYLKALPADQLAIAVSEDDFLYSPFTYVLDSSNNEFNVRPYYLDSPTIVNRTFIAENDTTGLQVSTDTFAISRTSNGYKLRLQTKSSDAYKAVDPSNLAVQLAFVPRGESSRAYLLGTYVGLNSTTNELIFEFDLSSNNAINSSHELGMTKFQMLSVADRITETPLAVEFDVLYSTSQVLPSSWKVSTIDDALGKFQLPLAPKAITHEKVSVKFGDYLEHLWTRTRTVVAANVYDTWAMDIPAVYEKDVYQVDPETGLEFKIVNGELVWTKLHSLGDPVLDSNGNPVYKFRKGDVKLDNYGNPIIKQTRSLTRQISMFLVEGAYYFATNQVTIDYRQELVSTVVDRLINDMQDISEELLELTQIYYYPTTTTGSVDVMYGAGLITSIQAGQSFEVTLYVKGSVYTNTDLREAIEKKTILTINDQLGERRVSISEIIDALRTQYGNDVLAFDITRIGGTANLSVVTLVDDSKRLSLRKKLVSRNDATLALTEDVTFNWVEHERDDLIVS